MVSENALVDCLLYKLQESAQGHFLEGAGSAETDELGASVPASGNRPEYEVKFN